MTLYAHHCLASHAQFIAKALAAGKQCCVVCDTGSDASAAMCIAALIALQFGGVDTPSTVQQQHNGHRSHGSIAVRSADITKETIRAQELRLQTQCGNACPQRRYMTELNKYFVTTASAWYRSGIQQQLTDILTGNHRKDDVVY